MTPVNPYRVQPITSLLYFILYVIFIYSFTMLPFPSLLNFASDHATSTSNTFYLVTNIVIAAIGMILFKNHFTKSQEAMQAIGAKSLFWIGAYCLIFFISSHYGTHQNDIILIKMTQTLTAKQVPIYLLVLIVAGPLMDTLIFQEILVNQLSSYLPKYLLAILSAMLYSTCHMSSIQHWIFSIPYFITMLIINILFIKSKGNLWYAFFGQMLSNMILLTMAN